MTEIQIRKWKQQSGKEERGGHEWSCRWYLELSFYPISNGNLLKFSWEIKQHILDFSQYEGKIPSFHCS